MSGMFMFPGMFYNHIKDSKLKMPEDFENYEPEEYPHFHVFILTHLGQPIDIAALEDNANKDINLSVNRYTTYVRLIKRN